MLTARCVRKLEAGGASVIYASDGNPVLRGASGEMGKFGKLKFTEAWYPVYSSTAVQYIRYNTDARSLSQDLFLLFIHLYTPPSSGLHTRLILEITPKQWARGTPGVPISLSQMVLSTLERIRRHPNIQRVPVSIPSLAIALAICSSILAIRTRRPSFSRTRSEF